MSELPCPGCRGEKKTQLVHVKYAPGYSGPPITELPCFVCDGSGTITDKRHQLMKHGEKIRRFRVEVLGLGLREAATRWGFSGSELSYIEQGRIATNWTPPGYKEQEQ